MDKFSIVAFRAPDNISFCEKFIEGHVNILKIYGITEITTANTDWFANPEAYVLLAIRCHDQLVVGGVRVHKVHHNFPLPIEDAVSEMDPSIHAMVKEKALQGAGELCGLWNAREVAGRGISSLLMRAGVSLSNQLNITTLFALCAPVTVPMVGKVGFVLEKKLGKDGTFYYPKSDLIATAVINDVDTLAYADPAEREIMLSLRSHTRQVRTEEGPKGSYEMEYLLDLNPKSST